MTQWHYENVDQQGFIVNKCKESITIDTKEYAVILEVYPGGSVYVGILSDPLSLPDVRAVICGMTDRMQPGPNMLGVHAHLAENDTISLTNGRSNNVVATWTLVGDRLDRLEVQP